MIFIDTSSLIKRYIEETGSDAVDRFFDESGSICISLVTPVEMRSALKRLLRENSIKEDAFIKAAGLFETDRLSFVEIPFAEELVVKALSIIDEYNVKTLDALQIGAAMLSGADELVTSDRQMYRVFQTMGGAKITFI